MELLERKRDMLLGNEDLETLYTFKEFPIYMGVTEQESQRDDFADMEWMISKKSGMIQLGKLVPDEVLYQHSHNSGYGNVWKEHYRAFSEFIHKNVDIEKGVLELGGGNGILNSIYCSMFGDIPWLIVEPSDVIPVSGCNAFYIRRIWDRDFPVDDVVGKFDVLVHSHVLEHLLDLNSFMEQSAKILDHGQKMMFSVPNLKEILARKYTNALNFEHTYFITDDYIKYILEEYGFNIIAKERYREDHSIFYVAEKLERGGVKADLDFGKLAMENRDLFNSYISYHEEMIDRLNHNLKYEQRPVYLFGAHIFSQYLINFGLDTSKIKKILDNDALKQGKRLYGTDLMVESPKVLTDEKSPIVILKVAAYEDEIKNDILKNINRETEFW